MVIGTLVVKHESLALSMGDKGAAVISRGLPRHGTARSHWPAPVLSFNHQRSCLICSGLRAETATVWNRILAKYRSAESLI